MVQMSPSGSLRSLVKAIFVASGDQTGVVLLTSLLIKPRICPIVLSLLTTAVSIKYFPEVVLFRAKASTSWPVLGDHAGVTLLVTLFEKSVGVPPAAGMM